MKVYFFLLLIIIGSACRVYQPDITQNEIFAEDDQYYGVKSSKGKVVIPPIYHRIFPYFDTYKKYYEQDDGAPPKPYPYYMVVDADGKRGIFAANGRKVFDFVMADALEIDLPTQTVVANSTQERTTEAKLYYLNGKMADTTTYQRIGYFPDNSLIILEKVKREEVYLLNIDQQQKVGPYDHFNLWEPYGMLAVRYQKRWGLIDNTGKSLLPMNYTRLWMMNEEFTSSPFYANATKPENITFIGGATLADGKTRILLDEALQTYSIIVHAGSTSIVKRTE